MKRIVNAEQHTEIIDQYAAPVIEVLQIVCKAIGWHIELQKPPNPDDDTAGLSDVDEADIEIRYMFKHLGDFFEYNVAAVRKDSHFINGEESNERESG